MTEVRPPYASTSVIDELFSRMASLKPPTKADKDWAKSLFGANLPSSIPSMLRWLGVVDEDYKPNATTWNALRILETRAAALDPLVRESYRGVFDKVEVETADPAVLKSAFIQAYGTGNTQRPLAAFSVLCRHAGITTGTGHSLARVRKAPNGKPEAPVRAAKPARVIEAALKYGGGKNGGGQTPVLTINLTVEILATWSEAQIAERISAVRRAATTELDGS